MSTPSPTLREPAPATRATGFALAITAAVCWSAAGIGIKLLPLPAPAIAGYRALFSLPLFMAALLLRDQTTRSAAFYRRALAQPLVWAGGLAYALCVTLFVLSNKLTTAANAILFQYSAPIYVALLSWPILREPVRGADWLAVLGCLGGVALCFSGELSTTGFWGNCLALLSGVGFGLLPLIWRRMALADLQKPGAHPDAAHLPNLTLVLGNVLTAAVCAPWLGSGAPTTAKAWGVLVLLGTVQIGVAYLLYAAAVRRIKAVEGLLAVTLEPILNPVWVALWAHEQPGLRTLLGGAIILTAVVLHGLLSSLRSRG